MEHGINTIELARIYESQGYHQKAFEIYSFLENQTPGAEITAGLNRMKKRLETSPESSSTEKIKSELQDLVLSLEPDDTPEDDTPIIEDNIQPDTPSDSLTPALLKKWMSLVALEDQVVQVRRLKAHL